MTNGDSFTYGDELPVRTDAWPWLVAESLGYELDNIGRAGASNDHILNSTVEYLEDNNPDMIIIGWTSPDRIDIGGKSALPNRDPHVFRSWNDDWARKKLHTQINILNKYVLKNHNAYHCCTWIEDHYFTNVDTYIGRFVDWTEGLPKGRYGHPLEEGHRQIADNIIQYIKNKENIL